MAPNVVSRKAVHSDIADDGELEVVADCLGPSVGDVAAASGSGGPPPVAANPPDEETQGQRVRAVPQAPTTVWDGEGGRIVFYESN